MIRALVVTLCLGAVAVGCKSSLSPETPRKYRCNRALNGPLSSECPGGWRCGLEGTCHDPQEAFAFRCESQDDCASDWHCGAAGTCYELATAGAVECRGASAGDCAPGWHCGLNGRCHDADAGAAYQCNNDEDCERGWRCDLVAGACVDSTGEALRPAAPLAVTRISPATFGLAEHYAYAGSYHLDYPDGGYCDYTKRYSAVIDGGLVSVQQTECSYDFQREISDRRDIALSTAPTALAAVERIDYLVDPSGLIAYRHDVDAGGPRRWQLAFEARQLFTIDRESSPGLPPAVLASGTTGFVVVDHDNQTLYGSGAITLADGGATGPTGLAVAHSSDSYYDQLLAAITPDGLYLATRAAGTFASLDGGAGLNWVAVDVPGVGHARCGNQKAVTVEVRRASDDALGLVVEPAVAPMQRQLVVVSIDPDAALTECSAALVTNATVPAPSCPPGQTVVDFDPYESTYYRGSVRCRGPSDAGTSVENQIDVSLADDGGYEFSVDEMYPLTSVGPGPLTITRAAATTREYDWLDEQGRRFGRGAFNLTTAPLVVLGGGGHALVGVTPELRAPSGRYMGFEKVWELGSAGFTWRSIFNGGELAPVSLQLCGGVHGSAELLVRTAMELDQSGPTNEPRYPNAGPDFQVTYIDDVMNDEPTTLRTVAVLKNTAGLPAKICWPGSQEPMIATIAPTRQGQRQLVVAAQDTVWAGSLPAADARLPDGGVRVAQLEPRITPVNRGRIAAIAITTTPSTAKESVTGYLIAQLRLFRVFAFDEAQWSLKEVTLPEGVPAGLWADGPNARVAFDDGTTLSLPSRTQIAGPVPNGAQQFIELCGQGYALTPDALYRLEPGTTASSLGQWVAVNLGAPTPNASTGAFLGGKLHASGNELYVFNRYGTTWRLTDAECQ